MEFFFFSVICFLFGKFNLGRHTNQSLTSKTFKRAAVDRVSGKDTGLALENVINRMGEIIYVRELLGRIREMSTPDERRLLQFINHQSQYISLCGMRSSITCMSSS